MVMEQLTEDAVAARKKGMTYGKYMAMKEAAKEPAGERFPKKKKEHVEGENGKKAIHCGICGKVIHNPLRNQKYCTGECADIAIDRQRQEGAKRRKERPFIGIETRTCEVCGCEYIVEDRRKRRTCGVRCRKLLNNRKTLEKYYKDRGLEMPHD